jgi:hypothetical protein
VNTLHANIANALVMYYAIVGVWGIGMGLMRKPINGSYRAALYLGVGVAVVQVLVGIVLLVMGGRFRDDLHFLYGLSLIISLPIANQLAEKRGWSLALSYGIASLFMAGLCIRGITTGR